MKAFLVHTMLLLVLVATGCGSTAKGPAEPQPDAAPIAEEKVKESYMKGPPQAQQMYEKYKKGGS